VQEIEALNAECLELEDQIASLKKEVQDAWGSYKSAQEKAAVREAELQDEIRQLQRAKQTDKQSLLSQMGKVGEEVDEAVRQMRAMQAERDNLQSQMRTLMDEAAKWEAKEAALEGQLAEVRRCFSRE
jgi:chromosome segregation ATPase